MKHYILDSEKRPVETDLMTWARWFEHFPNRRVNITVIKPNIEVSTVFLGIDHRFGYQGPPLLFESMVFVNGESIDCQRYSSWDDAVTGHEMFVKNLIKHGAP
jgi:hypothetical protein